MAKYLIDTCEFVDLLRGKEEAVEVLSNLEGAVVSFVTYGELLQGVRNKKEMRGVEGVMRGYVIEWGGEMVTKRAIRILKSHYHADGIEFLDAIIAALALERNLILVTENTKHFRRIGDLKVKTLAQMVK